MMRSFVYGTFAILMVAAAVCLAAPKPAIVQKPGDWTVNATFEHPQQIVWQGSPNRKPRRFWYTILTLTNKTNHDADFYPKCELMTDAFQIISAGKDTPPAVFERIKVRHKSRYPFLESLEKAGNRILQGEDNTKDIAIIWPDFDARAKTMKLFISGLSNETAVVDHPIQPKKVYLRKTLELSYALRGDPTLRPYVKLDYKGRRWVMR
ncbi:MAG: hypothetical protein ACYSW4_04565 [Planctomycetota bacterium]